MARLKHHDGLSRTVVAERRTPYEPAPDDICDARFTGDRFVSTYTYGPMGVINRYEENNNSNPGDDQILWYLSDAMGGHVHVLVDRPLPDPEVDRPPPTVNTLNTDAFGVRLTGDSGRSGMFGWRGQEGSVTDRGPNLVYMQNRHYDPSLGRFIQADTVLIASMTTQGMNRYIYTENDPVNKSDPTGLSESLGRKIGRFLLKALDILGLFGDAVKTLGSFFAFFGADVPCRIQHSVSGFWDAFHLYAGAALWAMLIMGALGSIVGSTLIFSIVVG